jgi:competence protein ComEA
MRINKIIINKNNILNETISDDTTKEKEESNENYYYVDIKGAVNNPNVYKVIDGSRIIDAINLAGGLTEYADTSILNLSKKINDQMFIYIYTKDEIKQFKENGETKTEIIKYIEKECNCPDPVINNACANDNSSSNNDSTSTKVSLNTANKEALMTLPGIGESKAQNIIDYRTANGLFNSIDDIKNVTGIGDSIFDQIKNFITL